MSKMTSENASVAKGVFAYKGKKRVLKSEDFISESAKNDGDADRIERMHVCEELWKKCNCRIQKLQSELGAKIFRELLEYICTCGSHVSSVSDASRPHISVSEIPAAALVMGVNMPDHAAMFSSLHSLLVKDVTPHVVALHSSKCQALKSAILNIALQLVPSLSSQTDSEEDDGMQFVINKSSCNISDIVAWYTALYQQTEPSAVDGTSQKSRAENADGICFSASPRKRMSSRTSADTPTKRQSLRTTADTPTKCQSSVTTADTPTKRQSSVTSADTPMKCQSLRTSDDTPTKCQLSTTSDDSPTKCQSLRTTADTPTKRQSSTSADTPTKRQSTMPPANKSPRKYPASPAVSRAGLRSGATPQKLQQIAATTKKSRSPTGLNSSPESEAYSVKHSSGKSNLSMTSGNSASPALSVSPSISPVKHLSIVVSRCEEFVVSPVAKGSGAQSSVASTEHISSPAKRKTPKKSHCPVANDKPFETELTLEMNSNGNTSSMPTRLLESSSAAEVEKESLPSVRHHGRPPVVILLEDFECFRSQLLQDLITICGYHISEMPVVLIFGIATTVDTIHRLLPHRVTSLLSMHKFQAPSSSEYLSMVLHQVLLNNELPFKLGGKTFDFVLDTFLYHDFSVLGFVRTFEYAMMEHFYKNRTSILCRPLDEACRRAAQLSSNQLADIRSCDSFQRHVKRQASSEQEKLMTDDTHCKKEITRLLVALDDFHSCFYPLLFLLHLLVHKLPGAPLGKQVREVYAAALLQNVFDTEEYQQSFKLLRTLSRDEILLMLTSAIDFLSEDILPPRLRTISVKLSDYRRQFESIADVDYCDEETDSVESPADMLPKKTNFYALRKTLQERVKQQKHRKLTVYEKLRNETVDFIDTCFHEYVVCPESLTLHEVFYYNEVSELRRRVCAAPRAAIQQALMKPYNYLKNEALNVTDALSAALPDICIIYRLHLECGRLINLYDWMQAFAGIVEPTDTSSSSTTDEQNISPVVQARFMRAVGELQFLGFIKATKRKTDHVERLTWGPW